jgi:hypothetical protein
MMSKLPSTAILAGLVAALAAGPAGALINPNFTPIHVVEQSAVIAVLDVPETTVGEQITLQVKETLKGESNEKALVLDVSTASPPAQAGAVGTLIAASGGRQALLFAGEFAEQAEPGGGFGDGGFGSDPFGPGAGGAGRPVDAQAFLHVSGKWISLYVGDKGQYQVGRVDSHMEGTWAGGTDMLERAVRYILTDEAPEVPSVSGVSWGTELKIATLDGQVTAARPVWLDDERRPYLFLACDRGDRLFRFDPDRERFEDVTAGRKLESASLVSAWGDLNGDGRPDLASWDGESLVAHLQNRAGSFRRNPLIPAGRLEEPCLGLAVVDGGEAGRAALVISTSAAPALLLIREDNSLALETLAAGRVNTGDLGPAGPCLAADFDGDLLPDLLQPFAKGGLLYKGDRKTVFAAPVSGRVALGQGSAAAFLGDYDSDGRFDVLTVAEDRPRLWHNLGAGEFVETREISGEFAYIAQPRGAGGMTGDINNDGRQDVLILYSDREPQLFFNRGFRSFGHAHSLDLSERDILPASAEGQQAGCLAEFSGYGAQDMVLALANGEVWALLRDEEYDDGLYAGVSLAPDGPFLGPLKVTAEADGRNLGAWNVSPGASAAFFGRLEAGPCTIQWQLPGGEPQRKEIILEDRPVWLSVR